jgi:NAD(P)-dependent dehydrogenase (short-subunit alcohol dehydrogenase family)
VSTPQPLLRDGLLEGRVVLSAGAPGVAAECERLGAVVEECGEVAGDEARAQATVAAALERHGSIHALVVDAALSFRDGSLAGLRRALDETWHLVRATATAAYIPDGAGGRVVLIGPAPDAGEHASAARAGLENMARTLSIEWARFGILPVAIAPGTETTGEEVAQLAAFLASSAGDYYSGCVFSLGGR